MALGTMAMLGLASAAGGVMQAGAAKSAAKSQAAAADQADETQRYIYDNNVALTETQRGIGNNALAALAFESGIGPRPTLNGADGLTINELAGQDGGPQQPIYTQGGRGEGEITGYTDAPGGTPSSFLVGDQSFGSRDDAQGYIDGMQANAFDYEAINNPDPNLDFSTEAFEASPGYDFRMSEGMKALGRQQSARGMRMSGAAMKDTMRFAQGTASQEYGNFVGRETDQFNRSYGVRQDQLNALRGLSGQGQQATQAQINAGNTFATNTSNNAMNRGQAQADGAIGVGNAFAGFANNAAGLVGQANSGYMGQNPGFGITPMFNPFGVQQ